MTEKSEADEIILSYNDTVLRKSDLDILSGPSFLNDRIIEFYFSYLASRHPSTEISLVPPSISFWIANSPENDSLVEFLSPLDLPGKKLIIFPVNDNVDLAKPGGGSHWSLLVFHGAFYHHDSCGGRNERHAKKMHEALVPFVGSDSDSFIECGDSPQQRNSYDCGLYVTAITEVICRWYDRKEGGDGLWFAAVQEEVNPAMVFGMRNRILELIMDLVARDKHAEHSVQ